VITARVCSPVATVCHSFLFSDGLMSTLVPYFMHGLAGYSELESVCSFNFELGVPPGVLDVTYTGKLRMFSFFFFPYVIRGPDERAGDTQRGRDGLSVPCIMGLTAFGVSRTVRTYMRRSVRSKR